MPLSFTVSMLMLTTDVPAPGPGCWCWLLMSLYLDLDLVWRGVDSQHPLSDHDTPICHEGACSCCGQTSCPGMFILNFTRTTFDHVFSMPPSFTVDTDHCTLISILTWWGLPWCLMTLPADQPLHWGNQCCEMSLVSEGVSSSPITRQSAEVISTLQYLIVSPTSLLTSNSSEL